MLSAKRIFSVSILFLLPLSGCFLRQNTVVEKFSGEFRCAKDQVKVEQPDKNVKEMYRAQGCNRRANYRCTGDYGEFCERVGQPETINPEGMLESTPSATPPSDSAQQKPAAPEK
jgi:hypothetical protein